MIATANAACQTSQQRLYWTCGKLFPDAMRAGARVDVMLKIDRKQLDQLEKDYPGIGETILQFEETQFAGCPHCDSLDTAKVQCGIVGRTINIAAATTKMKLIANGPAPAEYFCNSCNEFFG